MSADDTVTREHFDRTVTELKALIASLAAQPAPKEDITTAQIMAELRMTTQRGLMKWAKRYNLKSIARGVYRLDDFRAAKARAALRNGFNTVRRKPATKRLPAETIAA
jgi:hypothetical protein